VAPGNAGTAAESKTKNINVAADDINALVETAKKNNVGLTIVGPEQALVSGVVDAFKSQGLLCFGPSKAAAKLEGSKLYAKIFLEKSALPPAGYHSFTELDPALEYVKNHPLPVVIKADGLAAGKGVVVARSSEQAQQAVQAMLQDKRFGKAGQTVVIEDFLSGEEVSFIAVVSAEQIVPLVSSQDHKARDNGDRGPNTGGMGAYSPAPVITPAVHDKIMQNIITPTVQGLVSEGIPYIGFLYAGLMVDNRGEPRLLEYNCRLGDPETQPILMRMQSDLIDLCMAALEHRLDKYKVRWDPRPSMGVVMAAGGYPGDYRKGDMISGLPQSRDDLKVFHSGTRQKDKQFLTNGGRVLCVTAIGDTVLKAQLKAYGEVRRIHWPDAFYRTDIGYRAVARESVASAS
jgi:phosphoribosylamine--glycine ligase